MVELERISCYESIHLSALVLCFLLHLNIRNFDFVRIGNKNRSLVYLYVVLNIEVEALSLERILFNLEQPRTSSVFDSCQNNK